MIHEIGLSGRKRSQTQGSPFPKTWCSGTLDHLFLSAKVMYKDSTADHDIAKSCDGKRHKSVPGGEEDHGESVQQTEAGGAHHAPGGVEEGGMHAGDNVDNTVADDKEVDR